MANSHYRTDKYKQIVDDGQVLTIDQPRCCPSADHLSAARRRVIDGALRALATLVEHVSPIYQLSVVVKKKKFTST